MRSYRLGYTGCWNAGSRKCAEEIWLRLAVCHHFVAFVTHCLRRHCDIIVDVVDSYGHNNWSGYVLRTVHAVVGMWIHPPRLASNSPFVASGSPAMDGQQSGLLRGSERSIFRPSPVATRSLAFGSVVKTSLVNTSLSADHLRWLERDQYLVTAQEVFASLL